MLKLYFKTPHPMLLPASSYLAGLVCAHLLVLPYMPFLLTGGLLVVFSFIYAGRHGRFLIPVLCIALFIFAFGWLGWHRDDPMPENHIATMADQRYHNVEFVVTGSSQPNKHGWQALAEALNIDGRAAQGGFELRGSHNFTPVQPGQIFTARLRLRPILNFANPGSPDWVWLRAQDGVFASSNLSTNSQLKMIGTDSNFSITVEKMRARWAQVINTLPEGDARGLIRALTLGQRAEVSRQLKNAFAELGVAHLLAISGLHLGLVWGFFFFGWRWLLGRFPKLLLHFHVPRLAASAALIPTVAYALLGGASLPTIRALIMTACLVVGLWLNRPSQAVGALCLAALLICLLWPESLFTISFQLSFSAVCAIVLLAAPLARFLAKRLPRWAAWVIGFAASSGAIEIFIWPLMVQTFHQTPWLSLPANALLIPLTGFVLLPLALFGGALGMLSPVLGEIILHGVWYVAQAVVYLVNWFASLPFAVSYIAGPGIISVILIYLGWLCLFAIGTRARFFISAACLLAAVILWLTPGQATMNSKSLQAWAIDVGQGISVLVKLPDQQTMLVDCGTSGDMDPGQQIVAPFLWRMGISQVDIVVASHPHPDHFNGLSFILRWFNPRQLWINGYDEDEGNTYQALLNLAKERGVEVRVMRAPDELQIGGAQIKVLWPPADPPKSKANNLSLWLGIGHANNWLWLPGDNGPRVEKAMKDFPTGHHLMLAPHHGGKDFASDSLIKHLRPEAVICSTGCANSYGMPRRDGLKRLANSGAVIYITGNNGCIGMNANDSGWKLATYLNKPRACIWNYGISAE